MPQFFINEKDIFENQVEITGDDYRHLALVRRIRPGAVINLNAESGSIYYGIVSDVKQSSLVVKITGSHKRPCSGIDLTLYLCLLKSGNFEFAIKKASEVGVTRIIPVISERTVPDPDKKIEQKRERWEKIACEAGKQCLRPEPVSMGLPMLFSDVPDYDSSSIKIIGHPGASLDMKKYFSDIEKKSTVSLLVGPEGGFSEKEISYAENKQWHALNFGFTHLRAETAAAVISAIIIYEWSNQ